jgi:hypothetical protein
VTATPELFAWTVVILLTLEVLRRLPAAIRSPKSRTLWFVFAALDVSMTTRLQGVGEFMYRLTGIDDIATLAKHLVGIAAVAGLLRWVTAVVPGRLDGRREPGYRLAISNRPRRIVTWAAVVTITAIFPLAYRRTGPAEDADFIFLQAGHFWGSLHLLLFYAYLIFGMICASMMCASAARQTEGEGSVFKYGMQAMSIGCVVGSLYGIIRSCYLIARLFNKPFLGGDNFVDISSNFALIGCVLLVIGGSAAPVWERTRLRMEAHGAINDLRPMWVSLTDAVPSVVYTGPKPSLVSRVRTRSRRLGGLLGTLHDFWNWRGLEYRLRRRINEMCDVSIQLSPYISPQLRARAEETSRELGLPDHVLPAYLLRTAIQRKQAGEKPYEAEPDAAILKPSTDLMAATGRFLPIGQAMRDNVTMSRLDRRLASVGT